MDAHLNVFPMIRLLSILFIVFACALFMGCAAEPLTVDGRSPLAGEPTPPPAPGPRGGWAW
jgi:uncharacterized lipoprotein YajG